MECETICLTKFRQTWDNMNVLRCFWRLSKIFKNNVFYIHTKQFSLKFSLLDPLNITECPIWTLYAPCHLQEGCLQLNWKQCIHRSNAEGIQQPSLLGLWRQRRFLRLLSYAFRRQRGFHPRIRNLAILNVIVKVRIYHFVTAVRSIWLKIKRKYCHW